MATGTPISTNPLANGRNGNSGATPGNGSSAPTNGNPPPAATTVPPVDDGLLYAALIKRGKNGGPSHITLSKDEEQTLGHLIDQDFQDTETALRPFKMNMVEMLKNWRMTKESKNFPFEGASNIRVPFTSSIVETMKSRIVKAIFGGEKLTEVSKIDEEVSQEALEELNAWLHWELDQIVHLRAHFEEIVHNTLITGIGISIPSYKNETRYLHTKREFEITDQNVSVVQVLEEAKQQILDTKSEWGRDIPIEIMKESKPGLYVLNDGGRLVFSISQGDDDESLKLIADIWRREIMFNGVKEHCLNLEDLAIVNSACDVEAIPFFGSRLFVDEQTYREALDDKFFIDYGDEENKRIFNYADIKVGDYIMREQQREQDMEEGTDSTDTTTNNPARRWLEVYRWEGWWRDDAKTIEDVYGIQQLLSSASQYCVYYAPRPQRILRIKRLEDINKDGKRSPIKYDFIKEPGRFFSMGLAEWSHNTQAEMDAIHNQRLDAGLLTNVPFGFYKATSGLKQAILKIEPGKLFPVADPQGVYFPPSNWRPTFSFQEEGLVERYGLQNAGLGAPALGTTVSKRQSASEYVGTANALDLRTEDVVEGFVRSLRCELYRIIGLYQQYGPRERIFRVGGAGGVEITKRFEKDRLQGKLLLRLTANLQQMNEQLERQLALDMLQLLLNQILIQVGIVGPDTIFAAINKLFKVFKYTGVQLHEPDSGPISDPPNVENHQMFAKQKPKGPTMNENHDEHLQVHAMLAADSKLMNTWSPEARQMLQEHIQETLKLRQAKLVLKQQQAALATQMAQTMTEKGIRPGKSGGQKPNNNTGPGTQSEGVRGAGSEKGSAPTPERQ